jgi:hypothetical protein|tara:strand:- start:4294 stop:4875 length:582 start_codon:yes stop_codon:yes gene_type:complete
MIYYNENKLRSLIQIETVEKLSEIYGFDKLDALSKLNIKEKTKRKIFLIRVGDGENLKNSKYPFWGVKRGRNNATKTIVNNMSCGDIICFITSKPYGGKLIGMCEYTQYYDRNDEPCLSINTYTNAEQNWVGDDDWDIQIHYKKFYVTEKQNIEIIIQCAATIMNYQTFISKINIDLEYHYDNFKYYSEEKKF